MELVKKNITPSQILTKNSFENAVTVDMAFGGSTNTSLHLPAIGQRGWMKLSLQTLIESVGRPLISVICHPVGLIIFRLFIRRVEFQP